MLSHFQLQEKKELQGKIEHMATLEKELNKVQEMKPQLDELTRTQEKLKNEKEELEKQKLIEEEKTKSLEDKLNTVEKTKDEVSDCEGISSSNAGTKSERKPSSFNSVYQHRVTH